MLDGISTTSGLIVGGNVTWDDYQFSAPVRIVADSINLEASLVFRYAEEANFYWAGLGPWNHRVSIGKYVDGIASEIAFAGVDTELVAGRTYELSVKVVGSTIELYVDGILELSVTDTSHPIGAIGFRTYNSHVEVDYADVVAICPTGYHWDVTNQTCIENTGNTYTLTLTQSEGGTIYANKSPPLYDENEAAAITAVPSTTPLRIFDHWLVDGVRPSAPYDTTNPLQLVMQANHGVEGFFTTPSCQINYHWDDSANACVQNNPTEGYVAVRAYKNSTEVIASVTLDGQSDSTPHTFTVAPGTYNLIGTYEGITLPAQSVTVAAGQTVTANLFFEEAAPGGLVGPLGIWRFPIISWLGTVLPNVNANAQSVLDNINERWKRASSR